MTLPAVAVHLHHSVTIVDDDGDPHDHGDVAASMKRIERVGQQRFGMFPYSFCSHPSGVIAEGAGLTIGAHTHGYNSTTFGFCLIGDYTHRDPTDEQIASFGAWWRHMVANGWLRADAQLIPHRARKATACPGDRTIRRWDDFIAATQGDFMAGQAEAQIADLWNMFVRGLSEHERAAFNRGAHAILNTNHHVLLIDQKMNWIKDAEQRISQRILDSETRQNAAILAGVAGLLDSWTPEKVEVAITALPDEWLKRIADAVNNEAARRLGLPA